MRVFRSRARGEDVGTSDVDVLVGIDDAVGVLGLVEIGEALEDTDPEVLADGPEVPRRDVVGMRDHLAHRSYDSAHSIVQATIDHDLPPPLGAARRLLDRTNPSSEQSS